MKLGCFCDVAHMGELAEAGFEFCETGADSLYPTLDEDAFRLARQDLLAEPLFPEAIRLPDAIAWAGELTGGPAGSDPPLGLHALFRRAALVGCRTIVATVPGHQQRPDVRDRPETWRRAMNAIGRLAEEAARNGLALALSPNSGADGVARTIEEAWVLAMEVGHPAVGVVANVGAVQDLADMAAAGPALKHVHLPLPRRFGGDLDTTTCYEAVSALAEFGYRGRVSVAAHWSVVAPHAEGLLEDLRPLAQDP